MKKAELQYKAKLADMACMICERLYGQHPGGNVELHHLRTGGWGRGDYKTLIPLCVEHHIAERLGLQIFTPDAEITGLSG